MIDKTINKSKGADNPLADRPSQAVKLSLFKRLFNLIKKDPRVPVALILFTYLVLGFTVLGFNRTPAQALVTTASTCSLELILTYIFKRKWIFPFSALITSFSLSILLNYSHDYYVLLIPPFFAIGSKYVFTFKGRHVYNPALAGVAFSLLLSRTLISSAPAYQWNGIAAMSLFIIMPAILFFLPNINRTALVLSFLFFFTIETALRAYLLRYQLPFEALFLGALSSPAFFLFTFFMITDPMTSPSSKRGQILAGAALALLDFLFHLRRSYHTFFYAAFVMFSFKLLFNHLKACYEMGNPLEYVKTTFIKSKYYLRPLTLALMAVVAVGFYKGFVRPSISVENVGWSFVEVHPQQSGIETHMGNVLEKFDPRVHNIAKWIMGVGDSVAVGDFDEDGLQDLFFTNTIKGDEDRNALYKNLGNFQFERIPLPMLDQQNREVEKFGVPTGSIFVDYDNDGDLDLFIARYFGSPILLKNMLRETGRAEFKDVTQEVGLEEYTNSVNANFLDANRDGKLDLIIGNWLSIYLSDYPTPTRLNLFRLPSEEYPGDRRMFHFMINSWINADNGGLNYLYLAQGDGTFQRQDSAAWGLPETHFTFAIGTGDLNHDGWTDMYIANDFGPDDLYLNQKGTGFQRIQGKIYGSIGKDTYKGMNASLGDLDRNGYLDIYVSNVHRTLLAEGSLLWMLGPSEDSFVPSIKDRATQMGVLNEGRFGWGATLADFNNDGWLDIAQANGMVDDTFDKKYDPCPSYWYINEKLSRSPASIYSYSDMWGDVRGQCIYAQEKNRLYLNRGNNTKPEFIDIADQVGLSEKGNSRGMAAVDLDNDGRLDLVVTHMYKRASIYHNTAMPNEKMNWLGLELVGNGTTCNKMGAGSTVKVEYQDEGGEKISQMREVQVVNGFSAQDDRRVHFGLGSYQGPVTVRVNWCGMVERTYTHLDLNKYQKITME